MRTGPDAFDGLPAVPAGSAVERRPYDAGVFDAIARVLGQPIGLAPFRLSTAAVHRVSVPITGNTVRPGATEAPGPGEETVLTLWTSLGRVDAANSSAAVVATGIVAVDLVADVEVIFRHAGGSVTVARNGRIMVRSGVAP